MAEAAHDPQRDPGRGPDQNPGEGQIRWLQAQASPRTGPARRAAGWLALGLLIALVAIHFASASSRPHVSTYRVTSGSMEPTLRVGQVISVDDSAYDSAVPRVGDIVAFHPPSGATGRVPVCAVAPALGQACARATPVQSSEVFIKRVVAGPGDTVAIVDGSVLRNGTLEIETFPTGCDSATSCNFPTPIRVPAGEWYLMGDNRGRSDDSRYWGPVPTTWIIGRVGG